MIMTYLGRCQLAIVCRSALQQFKKKTKASGKTPTMMGTSDLAETWNISLLLIMEQNNIKKNG